MIRAGASCGQCYNLVYIKCNVKFLTLCLANFDVDDESKVDLRPDVVGLSAGGGPAEAEAVHAPVRIGRRQTESANPGADLMNQSRPKFTEKT
jgi:hypothetical protein